MKTYHRAVGIMLVGLVMMTGCSSSRFPSLSVAEENMMLECEYLDTISESSDPGKFVTSYQLVKYYDGELKVLERANNMAATHVVWMYNYPIGSSASVYRCQ